MAQLQTHLGPLLDRLRKTTKNLEDGRSASGDSNSGPPEYETEMLTPRQ
jgi:hypothetical protein